MATLKSLALLLFAALSLSAQQGPDNISATVPSRRLLYVPAKCNEAETYYDLNAHSTYICGTGNNWAALGAGAGGGAVSSVFARTGAVVAVSGDYTTALITEATNLYFTAARAQAALAGLYQTPLGFTAENSANKGASGGYAPLAPGTTTVPLINLPIIPYSQLSGTPTIPSVPVTSVLGRTGAVVAVSGDYTTLLVTEATNLYFTNARAVAAMAGLYQTPLAASVTTPVVDGTAAIGVSPNYALADHVHPTDTSRQAALGFTPENVANKGANSGYAPLNGSGIVPAVNLPATSTPYACTVSSVSSISCTHNLGTSTPWVACWDSINNLEAGSVGSAFSLTAISPTSTSVVALTFSGSATGVCEISTGSLGPTGAAGAAGATGPAGPISSYPGAGVPNSTGSAWGTSYAVGVAANDLVQLNSSAQLPALNGSLLTGLGLAATATALAASPTQCTSGQAPTGILASGNATGCQSITGSSGVSGVTGTAPVASSGGTAPVISLNANGITSSLMAVVNTRRVCIIDNDTQSATALLAAQFSGRCVIPAPATIVEVDVIGGTGVLTGTAAAPTVTGTGSIQIGKYTPNGGASTTGLMSAALATASGKACALTATSGTCINGNTSSSSISISTTALAAGDELYVSAAAPDAAQTWYHVAVIYTVN